MSAISGWQKASRSGNRPQVEYVPSQWETLLSKLELSEDQAAAAVKDRGNIAKTLKAWVRKNYQRRYVPESVLQACGVVVIL